MDLYSTCTDVPVLIIYNIDRRWPLEDIEKALTVTGCLIQDLRNTGHPVTELCVDREDMQTLLTPYHPDRWLVFNWCEELPGIPHSADQPVHILERAGFTFTGSSSYALALSQDKRKIKHILDDAGIPTPKWQVYTPFCLPEWTSFPAIIKPAFEHCSLGISSHSVVETPLELRRQVADMLNTFQQPVLVEEFIDGRELIVSVLGNGRVYMLPPAEMDFSDVQDIHCRLRTYDSKFDVASPSYDAGRLRLHAMLTDQQRQTLQAIVQATYHVTNCRDYARLDIRLREGHFYVLDVNPNPDISPDASLPLAAEAAGISYGQLGSILVNLAAHRHASFARKIQLSGSV